MTLCTLILGLLFPPAPVPQPPQGWLDCGFDARGVYVCKP
jgi:hypothetical protein